MDNPTEIPEILQKLQAKGWSVSAIGRAMGVSHITIWRWLSGDRRPANLTSVTLALRRLQRRPVPRRPYTIHEERAMVVDEQPKEEVTDEMLRGAIDRLIGASITVITAYSTPGKKLTQDEEYRLRLARENLKLGQESKKVLDSLHQEGRQT